MPLINLLPGLAKRATLQGPALRALAALVSRSTVLTLMVMATNADAQLVRTEGMPDAGFAWSRTWIDINNDGRDDFCALSGPNAVQLDCYFSDGSAFGPRTVFGNIGSGQDARTVQWADINGDGRPDLCRLAGVGGTPPTTYTLSCWLGSGFTAVVTASIPKWGLDFTNPDAPQQYYGLSDLRNWFLSDVDGDSRSDLCYLHLTASSTAEMRCRISNATASGGSFVAESAAWIKTVDAGSVEWPRGFYDFNGDGFADFCRVLGNSTVRCTLAGPSGFAAAEPTSSVIAMPYKEGAAFADLNGDGKSDFCRVTDTSGGYLASCTLSNGFGWELTTRSSPMIGGTQIGDAKNRWWVDINADGLTDYCRGVANGSAWDFKCRLSRGDGDSAAASTVAFGFSDVTVAGYEPGVSDTASSAGRGFCDATGSGVQTYCRMTSTPNGSTSQCYWGLESEQCFNVPTNSIGLLAGLVDPAATDPKLQARQPLMTTFSDGAGAETRITYLPMTNPAVYTRSPGAGSYPRALIAQPRSPVVYETRAWLTDKAATDTGAGSIALTGIARYFFKDLRTDTWAGSRGFRERWIFTEGTNTLDHIVNYQGLGAAIDLSSIENDVREIGLVKYQERYAVANGLLPTPSTSPSEPSARTWYMSQVIALARQLAAVPSGPPTASSPFMLLQSTSNSLADTLPTANPGYRYVGSSTVQSWDWDGTTRIGLPSVGTTTEVSPYGNVNRLIQTTTQTSALGNLVWKKTTTNAYAQDDASRWILGRLTRSEVVSQAPTPDMQIAAQATVQPRSAGSTGADAMSSSAPAVPQQISPAVLSAILQLLLDD